MIIMGTITGPVSPSPSIVATKYGYNQTAEVVPSRQGNMLQLTGRADSSPKEF